MSQKPLLQVPQETIDRGIERDRNIENIENTVRDHLSNVGGSSIEGRGIEIIEEDGIRDELPTPPSVRLLEEQSANPKPPPTAQRPIYRIPETPEEFDRAERSRLSNPTPEVEVLHF